MFQQSSFDEKLCFTETAAGSLELTRLLLTVNKTMTDFYQSSTNFVQELEYVGRCIIHLLWEDTDRRPAPRHRACKIWCNQSASMPKII